MESVICGNRAELKRRAQSRRGGRDGSLGWAGREEGQLLSRPHKALSELKRSRPSPGRDPAPLTGQCVIPQIERTMEHKAPGGRPPGRLADGAPGARAARSSLCREVLLAGPPTQKQRQGGPEGHREILMETLCPRPGRQAVYLLFYFTHFFFSLNQARVTSVIRNTKMRGVQDG